MESETGKNVLIGLFVTVFGGLILLSCSGLIEVLNGLPNLEFVATTPGRDHAEVLVKNTSTKPVVVLGYNYRLRRVVTPPPFRAGFAPDEGAGGGMAGDTIPTDEIVIRPDKWDAEEWSGKRQPFKIDAGQPNTFRVRVVAPERVGTQYKLELAIQYGAKDDPKFLHVEPFVVNVMAE